MVIAAHKLAHLQRYNLTVEERLHATMLIAVQDFLRSAKAPDLRGMTVKSIVELVRATGGEKKRPLPIVPPSPPKGSWGGARGPRRRSFTTEELNQRNLARRARVSAA